MINKDYSYLISLIKLIRSMKINPKHVLYKNSWLSNRFFCFHHCFSFLLTNIKITQL